MRKVEVTELETVKVIEMTDHEVKGHRGARDDEQFASSVFSLTIGVIIPMLPTWPAPDASAFRFGLHFGILAAAVFSAVVSGLFLRRKRRERQALEGRLDGRAKLKVLQGGRAS